MYWKSVNSSNIDAIAYDEGSNTLFIKFNDGLEYEYYDVPMAVYDDFLNADSKEKFGHMHIYKNYHKNKRYEAGDGV